MADQSVGTWAAVDVFTGAELRPKTPAIFVPFFFPIPICSKHAMKYGAERSIEMSGLASVAYR